MPLYLGMPCRDKLRKDGEKAGRGEKEKANAAGKKKGKQIGLK